MMELLELMKYRRSIRKYQKNKLNVMPCKKSLKQDCTPPNAGGGQRTFICAVRDQSLCEKIGKLNLARFDRVEIGRLMFRTINPAILMIRQSKADFTAPLRFVRFLPLKNFLYSIPDAFCCAENMVLEATELGISSCIIARGEETLTMK